MKNLFYVGLGGMMGSMARYGVAVASQKFWTTSWPMGTLLVNIIGCFLIGLLGGLFATKSWPDSLRLLAITGFLGGFTTFSAFGWEGFQLIKMGNLSIALSNIFLQVFVGMAAVGLGYTISLKLNGTGGF
jgi:CrcB protein